jgi:hypothetical protein
MRIATLTREWVMLFSFWLPQGYIHQIHLLSGFGVASILLGYMIYNYILSKNTKSASITKDIFYLIAIASIASGFLLYFGYSDVSLLKDIHYYSGVSLLLLIVFHIFEKFVLVGFSSLKEIFSLKKAFSKKDGFVFLFFISVFWALYTYIPSDGSQKLVVEKMKDDICIDINGNADEDIWGSAKTITLHTYGGANFNNGATDITIKALHNTKEIYFYISWDDSTKSTRHLPLIKTQAGWKLMQNGFYRFDEKMFYEDKLAVLFSKNGYIGGSKTVHLGAKPLKDKPSSWHSKGYHYTEGGDIADLWQWKATRSNYMYVADDCYIGSADIRRVGGRRYTAGYHCDPKYSGGFTMNYRWYKRDIVVPKRVPKDIELLKQYQKTPTNYDDVEWIIPWYDYKPYQYAKDNYPLGTIMPSVIYKSNREEGDRADIRAYGVYKDGRWHLEMVRFLKTDSKYDLEIKNGIYMWVSAFDHSQIAHTRHSRAIYLDLKE